MFSATVAPKIEASCGTGRDAGAQVLRIDRLHVDAVDEHLALIAIVETHDELKHGRLAGARGADDGDPFARRDREAEVVDDARVRRARVSEGRHGGIRFARAAATASATGLGGATIRGLTASSSAIRPAEPAAAETSFQTCDSSPSEVAPSTANSTNCDSRPPLMRPASTSRAPSQSTNTTLQKASDTATAIRSERVAAASRAAS